MPSEERYSLELSRDEMRSLKDAVEYLDTNHQWLTNMSYGEDLPAVYARVYELGEKAEDARSKEFDEEEKKRMAKMKYTQCIGCHKKIAWEMKNFNAFIPIAEEYLEPFYYPECICSSCTKDMIIDEIAEKYADNKETADKWAHFWEDQWGLDPCDFVS